MAPQPSDLNPTEHLWYLLERMIRQHYVSSKDMLKSVIKDQWEKIIAEKTSRFVSSMPKRLQERILFSDEAHFWLNGYVNKQNCRIWSEANPQVYVETPLHPEKLTVWCALWAGGILLQKR
ncbi:hypothetical protein TNCV_2207351 [Trichonephila clavipes]|uniref:Transposase n=1 Tax=Trichonephila clavipes TaxID=2585209 RepID=A0A8X6VFA6_TRICX|nr:hypothetical protein TNCV_2207351 [Trichonephila clavipes]